MNMNVWNKIDGGQYRYRDDGSSVSTEMMGCKGWIIDFRRFTKVPEQECVEYINGWNKGFQMGHNETLKTERNRLLKLLGLE